MGQILTIQIQHNLNSTSVQQTVVVVYMNLFLHNHVTHSGTLSRSTLQSLREIYKIYKNISAKSLLDNCPINPNEPQNAFYWHYFSNKKYLNQTLKNQGFSNQNFHRCPCFSNVQIQLIFELIKFIGAMYWPTVPHQPQSFPGTSLPVLEWNWAM